MLRVGIGGQRFVSGVLDEAFTGVESPVGHPNEAAA